MGIDKIKCVHGYDDCDDCHECFEIQSRKINGTAWQRLTPTELAYDRWATSPFRHFQEMCQADSEEGE
jgi:hypothetical protein